MLRTAFAAALVAFACNPPRSTGRGTGAAGPGWELVPPEGPFPGLAEVCKHLLATDPGADRCRLEGEPGGAQDLPRRLAGRSPLSSAVFGVAGREGRESCALALEAGGWFVLPLGPCQGAELGMRLDDLRFVPLAKGGAVALTMTRKVANGFDVDDDDPVPTTCTQELYVCGVGDSRQPRCTRAVELARRAETCRAGATPGGISWQWRLEAQVGEDGVVRLAEAAGPLPPDRRGLVGEHPLAFP